MKKKGIFKEVRFFVLFITLSAVNVVLGQTLVPGGKIYSVSISNQAYAFDHADYSVFIPDGVPYLRGIFIHQHGCTMEGTGAPAAYDIQYQEFAKKWHLALMGPDIYPKNGGDCHQWVNPEDGSGSALFAALDSFSVVTHHGELKNAPWLLWGHSGGGYWVLAMLKNFPERILAAVSYSAAFDPNWNFSTAAAKVPLMLRHAGRGDVNEDWAKCWLTAVHTFSTMRNMNGFASIAHNLHQNHNLSYLRYMTIPFYEAVLTQRLPHENSFVIRDMDTTKAWLGDTLTNNIYKSSTYPGDKKSMSWLPDSVYALKWREYVKTGTVQDSTPPHKPCLVEITDKDKTHKSIRWKSEADYESGIKLFKIFKNNKLFTNIKYQTFDTNGDNCIPVKLPKLQLVITKADTWSITSVNNFNLESAPLLIVKIGSSPIRSSLLNDK